MGVIYPEALYINATDWPGLYIGGTLVDEGDGMHLPDVLNGRTVSFTAVDAKEADEHYVMGNGGFPRELKTLFDHRKTWDGPID